MSWHSRHVLIRATLIATSEAQRIDRARPVTGTVHAYCVGVPGGPGTASAPTLSGTRCACDRTAINSQRACVETRALPPGRRSDEQHDWRLALHACPAARIDGGAVDREVVGFFPGFPWPPVSVSGAPQVLVGSTRR
jgi:hypothetical protein